MWAFFYLLDIYSYEYKINYYGIAIGKTSETLN